MYCSKCGVLNEDNALFCKSCGTSFGKIVKYAGFWRRFGAYLIDFIILFVIQMVIGFILGIIAVASTSNNSYYSSSYDSTVNSLTCLSYLISLVITVLYFAGFESSQGQATPGKRAMSVIVVDKDGNRISFGKAFIRYLGKILSGLILGVGYFMIGFTEKKQGLHDMIAGTYVVEKG